MKLPERYITRMKELLDEEYHDYINSFEEEKYSGLRVNTIKIQTEIFEKNTPFKLERIHWIHNGYYYKEASPAKHPYYHAGLYYIQEPSAMTPAEVFEINEGDKVLDLCAAPGGKSTELGAKLNNTGVLVSNDISFSRAKGLLKNIELFGITNSIVVSEEPSKLVDYFPSYFDKILVDAPCSGEGMFRKDSSMIKNWEECGVDYYCQIQRNILPSAAKMLKPGGYMLYSTCTFSPEENEQIISEFLKNHNDFEMVQLPQIKGFQQGRPDWADDNEALQKAVRLWPHKIKGEGHFIALLYKSVDDNRVKLNKYKITTKEKDYLEYNKFEQNYLNIKVDKKRLEIKNDKLYLLPNDIPELKGLRILRTGWYLGDIKKNRFEPSQAFAMGMKSQDCKNNVNLQLEDINVIKYLKGETIQLVGKKGWNLISVDDYPLGWAKGVNNSLKNKYYPGWRWM